VQQNKEFPATAGAFNPLLQQHQIPRAILVQRGRDLAAARNSVPGALLQEDFRNASEVGVRKSSAVGQDLAAGVTAAAEDAKTASPTVP
jgi:hypothetical protein